jgi:dolichol-phosphate mannosyltransferase
VAADLSVVVPLYNEEERFAEFGKVLVEFVADLPAGSEIIFVDDGSTDGTAAAACAARDAGIAEIRLLQHSRRSGQSAAVWTGVQAARADWIATLDGDGQNDPADIPVLLEALRTGDEALRLVMGNRTTRRDSWLRKLSSRVADSIRGWLLHDGAPDTGCGIKLLHRATFLEQPRFDHMHRFLPALFQRAGAKVISVPVRHRPRARGASKYGLHNRLWVGIVDLFGVRWLIARTPPPVRVSER